MTQTHTPLPWELRRGVGDDYEVFPTRGGPPKHGSWAEVAVCPDQYDEEDEARANATFIVTACNSYYDNQATIASQAAEIARLREALTEVMSWVKNWDAAFLKNDEWPATKAKVDAALEPPS